MKEQGEVFDITPPVKVGDVVPKVMDSIAAKQEGPVKCSPTIGKLASALAKAQSKMDHAAKDQTNPHFRSRYATMASVLDACRDALAANEIAVLQPASCAGAEVTVTTLLVHSSGEWFSSPLTVKAVQVTPQGIGSAITYARRYGLSAMVGIGAEDDDGEQASHTIKSPPTRAPKKEERAPGSDDEPALSDRIEDAKTVEQLKALVPEIKKLPESDQGILRAIYKKRLEEVMPKAS